MSAAVLEAVQTGMQNTRIVEHQQVTCTQQVWQFDKSPVLDMAAAYNQQTAGRALWQGGLCNQPRWQVVIEIGQ